MDDRPKIAPVECPCCLGKGHLLVWDGAHPDDPPRREPCMHCEATGEIVPDMLHREVNRDARYNS